MGHIGTHAFSVSLYPKLAYKPDVDFEPIGFPTAYRNRGKEGLSGRRLEGVY